MGFEQIMNTKNNILLCIGVSVVITTMPQKPVSLQLSALLFTLPKCDPVGSHVSLFTSPMFYQNETNQIK